VAMLDPTSQAHLEPMQMRGRQGIGGAPNVNTQTENSTRPRQRLTSAELYDLQRRFDHFIEKLNAPRRRYSP
jgi:hypothetical protein